MKLLLSSHTLFGFPLEETFLLARDANFDGIELVVNPFNGPRNAKYVSALIERFGMPVVSIHQPPWHWPYTSLGMFERLCRYARILGSGVIVAHLSVLRFHKKPAVFDAILNLEDKYNITIAFENGERGTIEAPPHWAWNGGAISELAQKHNLHLTLDVPKYALSNTDSPAEFLHKSGRHIAHIHLHGSQRGRAHRALVDSDRDYVADIAGQISDADHLAAALEVFPLEWSVPIPVPRQPMLPRIRSIIQNDIACVRNRFTAAVSQ